MMNKRIDIPAEVYEDEIVCFLAQDGIIPEPEDISATFRLEDNELEILRRLTC